MSPLPVVPSDHELTVGSDARYHPDGQSILGPTAIGPQGVEG